ncbi:hypothetical protein CYLTODRAFT_180085 [Cylindrobasidium torrendii FP15055 ss-10]|uniref:Uncharacterized protein n=1 Tax=Cylindrobasidium torrendii FP15055 ss-10 TaxID=1314674 RepID=A0A0D7AWK7_9AGAR|nr:hypothetical protein CYLTODRAFT_180085 [Cylindrobasidium torrendii FP15055 ss-10]
MASAPSFTIADFTSLVEEALDLEHVPDVSMSLLSPANRTPSLFSTALSRRPATVLHKFRQLVRVRAKSADVQQGAQRQSTVPSIIPSVSIARAGSGDGMPFLPFASRHELESRAVYNVAFPSSPSSSSSQCSPKVSSFPLTPTSSTYSDSNWDNSEELIIPGPPLEDPFAKDNVEIVRFTPPPSPTRRTSASRRTHLASRPPSTPPSCPLPCPPRASPPRAGPISWPRHPYAAQDLPTELSHIATERPCHRLSPRRDAGRPRAGSPFPLSLKVQIPPPVLSPRHSFLVDMSPPSTPEEIGPGSDFVDMTDSDEEESEGHSFRFPASPSVSSSAIGQHLIQRRSTQASSAVAHCSLNARHSFLSLDILPAEHCSFLEDDCSDMGSESDRHTAYYSARSSLAFDS